MNFKRPYNKKPDSNNLDLFAMLRVGIAPFKVKAFASCNDPSFKDLIESLAGHLFKENKE